MASRKSKRSVRGAASNYSASVYMASDADVDVEVGNNDSDEERSSELAESMSELSLDTCEPCQQKRNKTTRAKWRCSDCKKTMCDECNTMHGHFLQEHRVKRINLDPCFPCQKKNKTTDGNWYCNECNQHMCDDCKSYHEMFLTDHTCNSTTDAAPPAAAKMVIASKATVPTPEPMVKKKGTERPSVDSKVKPARGRSLEFLSKVCVKDKEQSDCSIAGSAFLPDGRLLLVQQYSKKLMVFNGDIQLVKEKIFLDGLRDVAVFNSSEVALCQNRRIIRVSVGLDITEIGQTPLQFNCRGISYISKEELAVTSSDTKALHIIKTDGTEVKRINRDSAGNPLFVVPWYVTVDRRLSRAYVSDCGTHKVTAVDLRSGQVVFTYQHKDLWRPFGLTLDSDGNIYCTQYHQTLHRISRDGIHDGVISVPEASNPDTISINPRNRTVVIAGGNSHMAVYQMK